MTEAEPHNFFKDISDCFTVFRIWRQQIRERKEEVTWERERDQLSFLAHTSISILLCKFVTDFLKMLNSSQTLKIIGMKFALPHLLISICWHLQHKQVLLPCSPILCVSVGFSVTAGPRLGQPHCVAGSLLPLWITSARINQDGVHN